MNLLLEPETIIIPQPVPVLQEAEEAKFTEKSRQCPICHVYYKYGNSYWQHVRYVHASFLIQCVICEKSYKRTTMAKHHVLHSHKIAWHLCGNYVRKIKKSDFIKNPDVKKETKTKGSNMKYFKKKTLHLVSCFNCYDCSGSFPTIKELFEHVKCHRGKENCIDFMGEITNEEVESVQNDAAEIEEIENFEVENADSINHVNGVLGVDDNHEIDGMDNIG